MSLGCAAGRILITGVCDRSLNLRPFVTNMFHKIVFLLQPNINDIFLKSACYISQRLPCPLPIAWMVPTECACWWRQADARAFRALSIENELYRSLRMLGKSIFYSMISVGRWTVSTWTWTRGSLQAWREVNHSPLKFRSGLNSENILRLSYQT